MIYSNNIKRINGEFSRLNLNSNIIRSHNPFQNPLMRFSLSGSLKRSNIPTFQYSNIPMFQDNCVLS